MAKIRFDDLQRVFEKVLVVGQFGNDRHCEERSNLDIYKKIASFLAMTKRQENSN